MSTARHYLVTLDPRTGTHTLHHSPSAPEAVCLDLVHRLPPAPGLYRMLIKAHDDEAPPVARPGLTVVR